jgi:hypothetical protein
VQVQESRFLGTYVCCYKSPIYDVLYSKRKYFWMRVYEIQGVVKTKGKKYKT